MDTYEYEFPTGTLIVFAVIAIIMIAALWKIFTKAGQPGWAAIIPIYNIYILCKVVGRPGWWVILTLIPLVGIVIGIILAVDLAKFVRQGCGFRGAARAAADHRLPDAGLRQRALRRTGRSSAAACRRLSLPGALSALNAPAPYSSSSILEFPRVLGLA